MPPLDDLLHHPGLWRAREQGAGSQPPGLPTGFAALDRCLPGGGWPRRGLIEILTDRHGIGELSLLMPALAAICGEESGEGWLAWISPPYQPYAPALAACRIDLRRVLVVRAQPVAWAMEQALRSGACSAALAWASSGPLAVLRRLQLAAEQAASFAVLFRPACEARDPSPAVLRIALDSDPAGLTLRILKSRGGRSFSLRMGPLSGPADAVGTAAH
jgi:hypothetical protein